MVQLISMVASEWILPSLPQRSARVIRLSLLSGRETQKLLLRLHLILLHKKYYAPGSVLLEDDPYRDPDLDTIMY